MHKILKSGFIGALALMPFAAFASAATIQEVLINLGPPIRLATTLTASLAILAFFWGLAMYIFGSSNDEKRKKGVPIMIWGIVALFVMLSIFGIINLLQATFQVGSGTIQIPKISKP